MQEGDFRIWAQFKVAACIMSRGIMGQFLKMLPNSELLLFGLPAISWSA